MEEENRGTRRREGKREQGEERVKVTWTERVREGPEGMEREVKGTGRKLILTRGRGKSLVNWTLRSPHTKWGCNCKEDLGKRGARRKGSYFTPFPAAYGEGQGSLGLLHTIKISVSAPLNRSVVSSSPLHMSNS